MGQTLSLFRLQQTDSQIDRITTRLQEIQKTLETDEELKLANSNSEETEARLRTSERQVKEAESEVRDLRIKIEQTEASLYNGKGFSPKELQDMQIDISAQKRRLTQLEDVQLNAMVAVEELENLLHKMHSQLEIVKLHSSERNHKLEDERNSLVKEMQKLNSERIANSGSIPAPAIELYDRLRQQRRGIAVAVISDKSCSACGAGLSPGQIQATHSTNQIILCPSCGRILYGN